MRTPGDARRRETAEHPLGTLKMRMGATHFLMKTLPKVASEMALHVLAYNLTRVMNIFGVKPLLAAIQAQARVAASIFGTKAPTAASESLRIDSSQNANAVCLQVRESLLACLTTCSSDPSRRHDVFAWPGP
jgi:hypothetical protein